MKKLSVILALILVCALCLPVSARWEEISSSSAAVSITSAGKLTTTATVKTYTPSSRISATVTLQKLSGSSYTTYDSWPASATGSLVDSNSMYVEKGTYRLKVEVSIYTSSGSKIESTTFYSSAQTYS